MINLGQIISNDKLGAIVVTVATSLSVIPLLSKSPTIKKLNQYLSWDLILGFIAATTVSSLLVPAFKEFSHSTNSSTSASLALIITTGLGMILIALLSSATQYFAKLSQNRNVLLFILAITLQNIPEGMAAGASALNLTTANKNFLLFISIHDFLEGFGLGLSLLSMQASALSMSLGVIFTGLVEGLSALLGAELGKNIQGFLPFMMSVAGGAMLMMAILEIKDKLALNKYYFIENKQFIMGVTIVAFINIINLEEIIYVSIN